jgi:hypothetical protein
MLFHIGFLIHRLLMLFGLYILYALYHKQNRSSLVLFSLLLVVNVFYVTNPYYLFHVISFMLLIFISYRYYMNYRENNHQGTRLLAASFGIITLSQVAFVFVEVNNIIYVVAEIIQLIAYMLLFITFVRVLKDGKKKEQT